MTKQQINKIKHLTSINNHTEARIYIAKIFNLKSCEKVLMAIKTIHKVEGSLPVEIANYRNRFTGGMLEVIKHQEGEEISDELYSAL